MRDAFSDRLSDYLDGELSADESRLVEAHLRECPACKALLNDLKRIVAQAQHLEPRPPRTDLWSGIESRLERSAPPRRLSLTLPQLAAAAALLIAVSAGTAVKLATPSAPSAPPAARVERATQEGPAVDAAGGDAILAVAPVSYSDAQYDAAVTDLEKALKAGRGRLDQATIDIVEHNLQIIDQAIAQARDALAADPANTYVSGHLVEARRRKLDLLRRAAALAEMN